jgi:hypothetical protein
MADDLDRVPLEEVEEKAIMTRWQDMPQLHDATAHSAGYYAQEEVTTAQPLPLETSEEDAVLMRHWLELLQLCFEARPTAD